MTEKAQRLISYAACAKAIRTWLSGIGSTEIFPPTLEHRDHFPIRKVFGASYEDQSFDLSQGSLEPLVEAAAELPAVHFFTRVFRPSREAPNKLLEFHYVSCIFRGDEAAARTRFVDLLRFVNEAYLASAHGDGERRHEAWRFAEHDYRVGCEVCEHPTDCDLDYLQQLKFIDQLGSNGLILTSKPRELEKYRFEFRGSARDEKLFEVMLPDAGEIGSGGEFETDLAHLRENYAASEFRKAYFQSGASDIDEAVEPYLRKVANLSVKSAFFGFSFERVMQSLSKEKDIISSTPFGVATRSGEIKGMFSSMSSGRP